MNNKDETTRWGGAIELMLVLVFVCVNLSLNQETGHQPHQQPQHQQK